MAAAGYPVYAAPGTDTVTAQEPADAVVALGGLPITARRAYELAETGAAATVVISDPYGDRDTGFIDEVCADPPPGPRIVCFDPSPQTTRGEARFIADLAAAEGWDRVAVMTTTYHVTRARFIVGRCVSVELAMVDADAPIAWWSWIYQYGYQTAGWVKALSQRGC